MISKAALFWDESYLWGIMMYKALRRLGIDFELINSEDIRNGRIEEFKAIIVPGGWASNKLEALGEEGAAKIREFVAGGGSYVGFCGGAGLATSEGLGLLDVKRKPLKERVPSLSGKVRVDLQPHPIWEGIEDDVFTIWWPSQFIIGDNMTAIASFMEATGEAFSSDINVGDMKATGWAEAEAAYGLNLNPAKMSGDPLVIEGFFGKGNVVASLIHFDSPGCESGSRALENLTNHLGLKRNIPKRERSLTKPNGHIFEIVSELHEFGKRNLLWFDREPLIQWKRGIRGFEYFTMYALSKELASRGSVLIDEGSEALKDMLVEFANKSKRLLMRERRALQNGEAITFAKSPDEEMRLLRRELFGEKKSYGGSFREVLSRLDALLYESLKSDVKAADEGGSDGRGLIHIYTGDGKGKTTASVGLALRAKSRRLRVLFVQFMKEGGGETIALRDSGVDVMVFDKVLSPCFHPDAEPEEITAEARIALKTLSPILQEFDIAVLDEFVTMVSRGIVSEEEALSFVKQKPSGLELVLTGRGAGQRLIDLADLVTQMEPVKHYYGEGVKARPGIEY